MDMYYRKYKLNIVVLTHETEKPDCKPKERTRLSSAKHIHQANTN